jgi:hypothetical protein
MMSRPYPASEVRELAHAADKQFRSLLLQLQNKTRTADELRDLLVSLAKEGQASAGDQWDQDGQLYLALAALDQAYRDPEWKGKGQDGPFPKAIQSLSRELAFPPAPDGGRFDSPRDGDQYNDEFRKALKILEGYK